MEYTIGRARRGSFRASQFGNQRETAKATGLSDTVLRNSEPATIAPMGPARHLDAQIVV
jgi:hypothetical protein